jgi:hypothetical protein
MPLVINLDDVDQYLGKSYQGGYIEKYVREIGCKSVVVEEGYVDRDYLIDYANYYSRSHEPVERTVTRLHFFKGEFSCLKFLQEFGESKLSNLCGEYLGFSVVKPIRNRDDDLVVGRTLLATYPLIDTHAKIRRTYLRSEYTPHLYGHELSVASVPFQAQDGEVSKCATVALWTVCKVLKRLFGTQTYSPAEITSNATTVPSVIRSFPSDGLILEQIFDFIRYLNLEKDVIPIQGDKPTEQPERVMFAKSAVKSYLHLGVPIIGAVSMQKKGVEDRHAIVITGYGENDKGEMVELYTHDDQIGPYCKTEWKGLTTSLSNEWTSKFRYSDVVLEKLIIPVYPKIRLPFSAIWPRHIRSAENARDRGLRSELFYTTVCDYKAHLLRSKVLDKASVLIMNMPRFLAVERTSTKDRDLIDVVYDATAVYPKRPIAEITYGLPGNFGA